MTAAAHPEAAHGIGGHASVQLLQADPDLATYVNPEDFETARRAVTVPLLALKPGIWDRQEVVDAGDHAFAILIVDGLVTHDLDVGGHPALELFGPGDVITGWPLVSGMLPVDDAWTVAAATRVAVLDDSFLAAVRRWPRLMTGFAQRLAEQRDRGAIQLAIAQQPRVDHRLLTLFWHLADRFGRMTKEGVVVPVTLTHEALGRLIGARRPTVTLALKALSERGAVQRRRDRSWLVLELNGASASVRPLADSAQPGLVAGLAASPDGDGVAPSPDGDGAVGPSPDGDGAVGSSPDGDGAVGPQTLDRPSRLWSS